MLSANISTDVEILEGGEDQLDDTFNGANPIFLEAEKLQVGKGDILHCREDFIVVALSTEFVYIKSIDPPLLNFVQQTEEPFFFFKIVGVPILMGR